MKNYQNFLKVSNLTGLSLEAMGFLLMLATGIDPKTVHSSQVTMDATKEELVAKGRVTYIEKQGGSK